MESIPSKNVENLFDDLKVALIDIKAVLDPFALLSATDFYSHLNKKLKESYRCVIFRMFPNQKNIHEKMMKMLDVQLSLVNMGMESIKIDELETKIVVFPDLHTPLPFGNVKEEVIEVVDATAATSTVASPINNNSKEERLFQNAEIENDMMDLSTASQTVAIDYENVKKDTNRKSDQNNEEWKKTQFKCELCEFTSFTRFSIKKHQLRHNQKPFKCNNCSKSFNDKETLSMHKKEHDELMPYSCSRCKRGFRQKDDKDQHEQSCKPSGRYNCKQCNFTCNSKTGLKSHEKMHSYRFCDHCNKTFSTTWNLQQHKQQILRKSLT